MKERFHSRGPSAKSESTLSDVSDGNASRCFRGIWNSLIRSNSLFSFTSLAKNLRARERAPRQGERGWRTWIVRSAGIVIVRHDCRIHQCDATLYQMSVTGKRSADDGV